MLNEETAVAHERAILKEGMALAKGKWSNFLGNTKIGRNLNEKSPKRAAITALLMENAARNFQALDETVRTLNVGSFDRFAFPLIRAIYPNLIATEIVSVQPMQGPTSQIFFLDGRFGSAKGSVAAGQTALSPINGHAPNTQYTAEVVVDESYATGDGATATLAHTTAWLPIRPGTLSVKAGSVIAVDTGNGTLAGTGITSGTVNYTTGAVSVVFAVAPANALVITASYRYVMEGNSQRPDMDINVTSRLVTADTHSLTSNWSVESEQDFKMVHGLDAQKTILSLLAEQIRYEIDRDIIADLFVIAQANAVTTWDYTPPTGVDYYRHQLSILNILAGVSNDIFYDTRGKAWGNFIVVGTNFATVLESLPQFASAERPAAEGVVFTGTLGAFRIYKDPWLTKSTGIMGFKGDNWLKAGYVYTPYVPLWRGPIVTLTDNNRRVGLMSRYGKVNINSFMYRVINITNYGVLS